MTLNDAVGCPTGYPMILVYRLVYVGLANLMLFARCAVSPSGSACYIRRFASSPMSVHAGEQLRTSADERSTMVAVGQLPRAGSTSSMLPTRLILLLCIAIRCSAGRPECGGQLSGWWAGASRGPDADDDRLPLNARYEWTGLRHRQYCFGPAGSTALDQRACRAPLGPRTVRSAAVGRCGAAVVGEKLHRYGLSV
jgi:hypothetical protein